MIDKKRDLFVNIPRENPSSWLAARINMVNTGKTIIVCVRFLMPLMVFFMVFDNRI